MPSAWDNLDLVGRFQRGMGVGAQLDAQRHVRAGDYERAAQTILPYDAQQASAWAGYGEAQREREEKRETARFDRDVRPMILGNDFAGAARLANERGRPTQEVLKYMDLGRQMDEAGRAKLREMAAQTAIQIRGWGSLPLDQKQLAYEALRQRLAEENPAILQTMPEQYGDDVARRLFDASRTTAQAMALVDEEEKAARSQHQTLTPEEVRQRGYRPGSIVQLNPRTGEERVVQAPREPREEDAGFGPSGLPAETVRLEREFSKDWRGVQTNFADIKNQYERMVVNGRQRNSTGDLALVVSFTKMLDPGSVAREGEVALTQSAASALAQVQNFLPRLQQGNTLLPDAVRDQLLASAREMYGIYANSYRSLAEDYKSTAESYGFDVSRVMMGYRPEGAAPAPAPDAKPATAAAPPAPTTTFSMLPPAAQHRGRYITNHEEKKTVYSNGVSWVDVPYRGAQR